MSAVKTLLVTINVQGIGPEAATQPEASLHGRDAHGRYTYGGGLARVLDMLRRQGIHATLFWPVFEAERCRGLLEQSLRDGHEAASQGNAYEDLPALGEREGEVLERARDRLAALTGSVPQGFRYASGFTANTVPLLHQLGYRYDSSAIDDDAPYMLDADGGPGMVELPWSEGLCDATHFSRRVTQDRAYAHWVEQGDALLAAEGYACLTLHPRADNGVGRAARLLKVEQLLERFRAAGASFKTCADLAAASPHTR
ncbi:polysaccharide deacetylase family protein [Achromobacter sp. SD115]|uniref:polysaccharide deacetylase family protein n=1 Tax=Achromobacter sp. SD115 TaxID=2782011 RepID=UPI001A97D05A|nr:polysaccharide deacetylase family protein [Achromobacter sp. SD115]MBO1018025.1 polysaccharide deacetylase family protein [Achromobacter sp. SD115]